jgi:hypothetical protein
MIISIVFLAKCTKCAVFFSLPYCENYLCQYCQSAPHAIAVLVTVKKIMGEYKIVKTV